MMNKLKMEVGVNQVSKMTHMIKDMTTSKTLMERCRQVKGGNEIAGITFVAEVLSNGSWPGNSVPCTLPREIKTCQDEFDTWYCGENKRKTLRWLYGYGNVELKTLYAEKSYIIVVNVQQAAVLCLFNDQ